MTVSAPSDCLLLGAAYKCTYLLTYLLIVLTDFCCWLYQCIILYRCDDHIMHVFSADVVMSILFSAVVYGCWQMIVRLIFLWWEHEQSIANSTTVKVLIALDFFSKTGSYLQISQTLCLFSVIEWHSRKHLTACQLRDLRSFLRQVFCARHSKCHQSRVCAMSPNKHC